MKVNIKKKRFILLCLIFSSLFLYFANNSVASEDYVGIKEGDIFIWEYSYNEDLLEDYYEDFYDYLDTLVPHEDEFASAVEVFNNTHLEGLILWDENDEDWYKIYAIVNKNITIFINFTSLYDFDIDTYDMFENDIGYSKTYIDHARCVIFTPYTGYYYVNIDYYGDDLATYDINFNITEPIGDSYERNNDFNSAASISGCFSDNYVECSYNDDDYYKYYLYPGEETVKIKIEFNNSKGNLDLYLYNPTQNLVDYSNSSSNNYEQIIYTSTINQYIYIKVRNNDTWSNNHTYNLMVGDLDCFIDHNYERDIDELVDEMVEIQGVKFEIEKIKDEKNDKVEINYERSETKDIKDEDAWKDEDDRTLTIYDPNDEDFYDDSSLSNIIAVGVNWNEWAKEIEDNAEEEDPEMFEDCTVTVNLFKNGLTMLYEFVDSDMENYEMYYEYNSDGVIGLQTAKYGEGQLVSVRLRGYLSPEMVYFLIGAVIFCVIAFIALIIIIKKSNL